MWGKSGYCARGAVAGATLVFLASTTAWSQPLDQPPPPEPEAVPPPPPAGTSPEHAASAPEKTPTTPAAPTQRNPPSAASQPASPSQQPASAPATAGQPAVIAVSPRGHVDVTTAEPPPSKSREYWTRPGTLFVPRVSLGVFGDGDLTFDGTCHGDCPVAITDDTVSVADKTRVGVGAEVIQSFRSPMRFGIGMHYVPRIAVKPDGLIDENEEDEKWLGASLEVPLILEGVVPTSDKVGLAIRGMFGPALFFPGGAWSRDNHAYAEFCDEQSGADKCRVRRFVRGAWTYGIGGGPVLVVGPSTALRADVVVQFTKVKLFKFKAEDEDWEARQEYRFDGYRLWVMLGLEVM